MKIVKLNAENIKRLQAVEITPKGDVVTIAGRNGAGKSSVLDSIWWALAGTSHIQAEPIRKGQTKARIRLDLGEIVVERRFTEGSSTLFVENAEGARFPSPQKMLDALLGELSFDPLAFSRMEPREQFDELRRVSKLEVDLEQLDGLNRSDYAKRTDVNREARAKRAQADGIAVPAGTPDAAVDQSALVDELQRAGERNAEIERNAAHRREMQRSAQDYRKDAASEKSLVESLRRQIAEHETRAAILTRDAEQIEQRIANAEPLPDAVDVKELRAKIEQARVTNENVAKRERRTALTAEAVALEGESRELSLQMEAREKAKAEAIKVAAIPVPGLGFGDGIVTFNGIPFDQASSAEQLRVSLAIAMAANPKIRVIRIQDGSLLDDDSLAAVAEMAKLHDYQVWIERVASDGKVGIMIEDGMVKREIDAEAAE
jgi:predicted ABC-type transport system involved in lysophospholipase L1 biosynthesis ATPase subunit